MIVVIHLGKYYDWEPTPVGVVPEQADLLAKRVKPGHNGGWLMRVPKIGETHTTISLPEAQIVHLTMQEMIRDRRTLTRSQAVNLYLSRQVMPHHAHRSWMKRVEVDDDGPDEALFRSMIAKHVDAGNLEAEDVEDMVVAYLAPSSHKESITTHFGIKEST